MKAFDYLRPRGEILVKKDEDFHVICFEINDKGWFTAIAHHWPNNIQLDFAPNISVDNLLDSGVDTIH